MKQADIPQCRGMADTDDGLKINGKCRAFFKVLYSSWVPGFITAQSGNIRTHETWPVHGRAGCCHPEGNGLRAPITECRRPGCRGLGRFRCVKDAFQA